MHIKYEIKVIKILFSQYYLYILRQAFFFYMKNNCSIYADLMLLYILYLYIFIYDGNMKIYRKKKSTLIYKDDYIL